MTYKTLLFPLGADRASGGLPTIVDACNLLDCHRVMFLIQEAPSLPMAIELPVSDQWMSEMNLAREQASETGHSLEKCLHEAGLNAEVQVTVCERPEIERLMGLRARYADLGVLVRSLFGDQDVFNRALFGLLFQSGKPVLVVPGAIEVTANMLMPQTVMLGWDGGLPASRAAGFAIDILRGANDVHVVCIDPRASGPEYGEAPGWDLANYLVRHNINATVTQLSAGGLSISAVLSRHALEIGAELIVMGGYGHSRLRERLLGGTTRAMIEDGRQPILMAH